MTTSTLGAGIAVIQGYMPPPALQQSQAFMV